MSMSTLRSLPSLSSEPAERDARGVVADPEAERVAHEVLVAHVDPDDARAHA
jgi:hypothetical protein